MMTMLPFTNVIALLPSMKVSLVFGTAERSCNNRLQMTRRVSSVVWLGVVSREASVAVMKNCWAIVG